MNNKQRRSVMTEIDRTAPKGAIHGSIRRALSDVETNPEGGEIR